MASRRDLLADPASMSYNVRWELDFPGYDNESGGLPFHEDAWPNVLFAWSKPGCREYFLAFVDDQPVGHAHYSVIDDAAHIGVNILGRLRGRGYGTSVLAALVDVVWSNTDVREIVNDVPTKRIDADRMHARLGFERDGDHLTMRRPGSHHGRSRQWSASPTSGRRQTGRTSAPSLRVVAGPEPARGTDRHRMPPAR